MGRANYIGYFVDLFVTLIGSSASFIIISMSVSIYVGIFLYITGMVKDMKMCIESIDDELKIEPPSCQTEKWSIYVNGIEFHTEIIGYLLKKYSRLLFCFIFIMFSMLSTLIFQYNRLTGWNYVIHSI